MRPRKSSESMRSITCHSNWHTFNAILHWWVMYAWKQWYYTWDLEVEGVVDLTQEFVIPNSIWGYSVMRKSWRPHNHWKELALLRIEHKHFPLSFINHRELFFLNFRKRKFQINYSTTICFASKKLIRAWNVRGGQWNRTGWTLFLCCFFKSKVLKNYYYSSRKIW